MKTFCSFVAAYFHVLMVGAAFISMVVFSYILVRDIEDDHLRKEADMLLSHMDRSIAPDQVELYKDEVLNMRLADGGFGILLNDKQEVLIHPDSSLIGKKIDEGRLVLEHNVVFSKEMANGWVIAVAAPEKEYYKNLKILAEYMSGLGAIFILLFAVFFVRIIKINKTIDKRMRNMLDLAPSIGICFLNKNAEILDCNKKLLDMFAISSVKEYSEKFTEISPKYQPSGERSSKKVHEYVHKAFVEGSVCFEWMHTRLDKTLQIPCEVTLVRVEDEEDFIVGYIRDLREYKTMLGDICKKTLELESMNHKYESILDAIPLPVSVQDLDAKWTFVNTATEALLKKKREDIIGLPCCSWGFNVCNTDDCAIVCAKIGIKQIRFLHEGVSYKANVECIKDLDGKVTGYVEILQDVTEVERMAKAEAESASRAKSAFLARTSHEIRTPMNAILGVTEIQLQDSSLPVSIREAFLMIYNSSNLLLGIINNILDLSKIEADKMELIFAKYDVASFINDAVQLNIMQNSRKIEFELYVDENVPSELIGDEIRVKQILNNLLSNAFKYTKKGRVKLSVLSEASDKNGYTDLILHVNDTGQGMTEDQVSELFTEYARFNMESNRSIEGTGLGMNIVQHLVRMMKGKISVNSELGKGTTFTVCLPQQNAETGTLGPKRAESLMQLRVLDKSKNKGAQFIREYMPYGKVLIVDDVESNLFVARGLMMPYGLTIDIVSSGFDAIEKIKNGQVYDIIFMDHMMPKMDGFETTKIIRNMGYKNPIVALTANALIGQAKLFLESGFDEFVSKPIDIRYLNSILNKLIRDKQPPEIIAEARLHGPAKPVDQALAKDSLILMSAQDAKKALPVFESALKNIKDISDEELHMFAVKAHSMKSVFANIGESTLSEMALELEMAGKKGDKNIIELKTQGIIDALVLIIKKSEVRKKTAETDSNKAYLREQLEIIGKACKNYDLKTADRAVEILRKMSWTKETTDIIDRIAEYLLSSDFEEASLLANGGVN
ncbi:MAG: ATP-binding protein [Fibromonadales bacterium]|nr:ATP-binding protein [Fibromonadales bacterium]